MTSIGGNCWNLIWSRNFWLSPGANPNAYNNSDLNFDKRMWILIRRTCNVGASHNCVNYAQPKLSRLDTVHSPTWFKKRFITRRKWQQANPKVILNFTSLLHLSRQTILPELNGYQFLKIDPVIYGKGVKNTIVRLEWPLWKGLVRKTCKQVWKIM
jgi:hypothetical protein